MLLVVRARSHGQHLATPEPSSSEVSDRSRADRWDRERLNRREGHRASSCVLDSALRVLVDVGEDAGVLPGGSALDLPTLVWLA